MLKKSVIRPLLKDKEKFNDFNTCELYYPLTLTYFKYFSQTVGISLRRLLSSER